MKIIRTLLFLFIPIIGYTQDYQPSLLEYITCNLPDTVYNDRGYLLEKIEKSWRLYSNDSLQSTDWPNDSKIFTNYNFDMGEGESLCIDTANYLYKIGDGTSQLQVKIFRNNNGVLIGVSFNFDAHECYRQDYTLFYLYGNNTFTLQNDSVYPSFFGSVPDYLHTFTDSDTVLLIRDYGDLSITMEYEGIEGDLEEELVKLGADPETALLTMKYVMINGQLELVDE